MEPYERFEAWQCCHELVLAVYRVTATFPRPELYGLVAQARRAAFSAAANIVEGSARKGTPELRRFLNISLGSLAELPHVIRLSRDLGYLNERDTSSLMELHRSASKLTWGLYAAVSAHRPFAVDNR